MRHFVILFKYAGKWHKDVFLCENVDRDEKDIRLWLTEATRFAIERQGLREDGFNTIEESQMFEIIVRDKTDGSGEIGYNPVPKYAMPTIALTNV